MKIYFANPYNLQIVKPQFKKNNNSFQTSENSNFVVVSKDEYQKYKRSKIENMIMATVLVIAGVVSIYKKM